VPDARVFVLRIRRDGKVEDAAADTVLKEGDVLAVTGARDVLVKLIGPAAKEVEDPELLSVPVEGVDVYVTSKAVDGKTLAELAQRPSARGVFLRKITRGAVATSIPILPNTTIQRGDIVTLVGRTQDTTAATKDLGVPDRASDVADVAFMGLVFGWLRSVKPFFGRMPEPAIWIFDTVGLCVFIGVVGLSAGPGFVTGLQKTGISLVVMGLVCSLAHGGDPVRTLCVANESAHPAGGVRRRGNHHGRAPRHPGRGTEQGSRARLHGAVRHRQHSADSVGARHRGPDVDGTLAQV
jgi:putative transport protein